MFEVSNVDMRSPAVAKAAAESAAKISAIDGVDASANPFVFPAGLSDPRAAALLGDQDATPAASWSSRPWTATSSDDAAERVEAQVVQAYGALGDTLGGATGAVGSGQMLFAQITDQIEVDLRTGEGIALPLSFALMVVVVRWLHPPPVCRSRAPSRPSAGAGRAVRLLLRHRPGRRRSSTS